MEKVKRRLRDLPILSTFIVLSVLFILIAMLLVEVEKTVFSNAQSEIAFRYSDLVEGFNSKKVWADQSVFPLSEQDSNRMWLYEMCIWTLPPVTYFACFVIAGLLFYKSKIRKPLALLCASSARIADSDLDFSLQYDKNDEMGTLCMAFEKMRSSLENNNREMWRQMNERRRLNAAFSHDLRTPLTVLEGHLGILQKYTPNGNLTVHDTMETYAVMAGQIERLKSYVVSMSTLQRLEDISITRTVIPADDFISQLNDTAAIVCNGKQLRFFNKVTTTEVKIDSEIVMQVFENLLSNAMRYTNSSIDIHYSVQHGIFSIKVIDDGKGFDNADLKLAATPFYTTEKKQDTFHLGLGLNICKILCERHDGSVMLSNRADGGAVVTVQFGMTK
ncbi:MAG: HAMP domain-containing sensor histidine kinase [Paludibacter sp.]|nr:HAMP domain-containing sensor histidine kinase [Paludibacter sp.]